MKLSHMQLQSQFLSQSAAMVSRTLGQDQKISASLLTTTALRIRQRLNLPDLFAITLSELRQNLHADRVLLWRAEQSDGGFVLEDFVADDWQQFKGKKVFDPHFSQYWQSLYEKGRIQATTDIYAGELNQCYVNFLAQFQIRANLVVPILQKTTSSWEQCSLTELKHQDENEAFQLWGLLTVQQCSAPRQWEQSEIDLVDQIAVQLEIAIHQAELCNRVQNEVALRQITEVVTSKSPTSLEQDDDHYIAELETIIQLQQKEIAERKFTERSLLAEKVLVQTTLNSIGHGVISVDKAGHIHYLNPVAEQLVGWSLQEVKGIPIENILKIINEETRRSVENPMLKVLRSGLIEKLALKTLLVSRDGTEYPIEDSAAPIRAQNGEMLGAVLTFHDVTYSRNLARQLSWQANHDELTGLFNRRAFEKQLTDVLVQTCIHKQTHTLCYLDLDRFKVVNDTCGHAAGDHLLQQVTALFQERIRLTDTLARLGGDEFALLLYQCDLPQAEHVADDLRTLIQDFHFSWDNKVFKLGLSIGLVSIDPTVNNLNSLLRSADAACYAAKEKGRNCIYTYRPQDGSLKQRQTEAEWISRIDQALVENRFQLYQQKISPLSEGLTGDRSEILLRLVDEQGKLISPQHFIPAAERYHLITAIDQWVIKSFFSSYHAFSQEIVDDKKDRLYNINISGGSVNDTQFLSFLKEQLEKFQVPPHRICFEITETTAISNLESASSLIQEVKELGCSFALDDFGRGMSSLTYLKHLPIDYLKIDGGFVKDIANSSMDYAMVEAFNHLSHLMGIQTIAECVEDETTMKTLTEIGVDFAQGFCISRPTPLCFSMEGNF